MHKNNFDFLRLIFALLVVVHHSFPLSGVSEQDSLFYATNGLLSFSYIGVRGFFVISGFLIFPSLMRSKNLVDYFVKRVLRIYPGLFVVLVITLLFSVFLYESSIKSFFINKEVYTYIPVNLSLIKLQNHISGVFESNIFPKAINGSLWTIVYEFTMYCTIALFIFIRKKSRTLQRGLLLLFITIFFTIRAFQEDIETIHIGTLSLYIFAHNAIYFYVGALLSTYDINKIKFKAYILIASFAAWLILLENPNFEFIQYFLFPVIVLFFGTYSTKYLNNISETIGDLSYGVYIYGFPIQQTFMHFFALSCLQLTLVATPFIFVFAWLSWHLVEKKALNNKSKVYAYLEKKWKLQSIV
ncbi:MAG: acyltransferase [Chitinophagales bacterium]